jgi:uncharacterized damage-inducible protein DinB
VGKSRAAAGYLSQSFQLGTLLTMERAFPDPAGDERAVLTGWLDWGRATVRRKVEGLSDGDGYRALIPTSPRMTVAGVVSHLRHTERSWFAASFPSAVSGDVAPDPLDGWEPDRRTPTDLVEAYEAECAVSRRIVADLDLGALQESTPPEFTPVTVRWILAHMVEETARHVGHLDLLREQLDGVRGY